MTDIDTTDEVLVTRDDAVVTITLHRPETLNAITPTMLGRLGDELDTVAADDGVRVVVLTGAGRAFSAGVDLKALGDRELVDGKVGDILDLPARRVTDLLSTMSAITVAKVNGFCFTGALELALACDLVVAADEAKFGDTHAKFGLRPTWGMSQRLPELVGLATARELSYTARTFTGAAGQQRRLAGRVQGPVPRRRGPPARRRAPLRSRHRLSHRRHRRTAGRLPLTVVRSGPRGPDG